MADAGRSRRQAGALHRACWVRLGYREDREGCSAGTRSGLAGRSKQPDARCREESSHVHRTEQPSKSAIVHLRDRRRLGRVWQPRIGRHLSVDKGYRRRLQLRSRANVPQPQGRSRDRSASPSRAGSLGPVLGCRLKARALASSGRFLSLWRRQGIGWLRATLPFHIRCPESRTAGSARRREGARRERPPGSPGLSRRRTPGNTNALCGGSRRGAEPAHREGNAGGAICGFLASARSRIFQEGTTSPAFTDRTSEGRRRKLIMRRARRWHGCPDRPRAEHRAPKSLALLRRKA